MIDLAAALMIGFVGSLHCLGMCGPLVLAYSLNLRDTGLEQGGTAHWRGGIMHHTGFNLGRILTYGFLGALAAALGGIAGFRPWLMDLRGGATLAGGLLLVAIGFMILKIIPALSAPALVPGSFLRRVLPRLLRAPGFAAKIALGLTVGFLPCMLSWAMIIKAATSPGPVHGFLTMALFGLGTMPVMFLRISSGGIPTALMITST